MQKIASGSGYSGMVNDAHTKAIEKKNFRFIVFNTNSERPGFIGSAINYTIFGTDNFSDLLTSDILSSSNTIITDTKENKKISKEDLNNEHYRIVTEMVASLDPDQKNKLIDEMLAWYLKKIDSIIK